MDKNIERLLNGCKENVEREWGRKGTALVDLVGPRVYRALLAEAVLRLLNQQDDMIDADTLRKIIENGAYWTFDESEK